MAIELVSAGHSLTSTPPSTNVQDGDYVVAIIQDSHACPALAWNGTMPMTELFRKAAGGNWATSTLTVGYGGFWEPGETFSFSGACNHWLTGTAIYRGVDPDVPVDVATLSYDCGPVGGHAGGSRTTSKDGGRLVMAGGIGKTRNLTAWDCAALADKTTRIDHAIAGDIGSLWLWDGVKETAGATGTITTWWGAGAETSYGIITLRAAPEPAGKSQSIIIAS